MREFPSMEGFVPQSKWEIGSLVQRVLLGRDFTTRDVDGGRGVGSQSTVYTVNPGKRLRIWKLHPAKRALGQRTCIQWKSVYRVLRIPYNADRCALNNSIFGFSKCYLYIDPMKYLKLSCQGSNHHPSNRALSLIQRSKVSLQGLDPQPSDFQAVLYTTTLKEFHIQEAKFNNLSKRM